MGKLDSKYHTEDESSHPDELTEAQIDEIEAKLRQIEKSISDIEPRIASFLEETSANVRQVFALCLQGCTDAQIIARALEDCKKFDSDLRAGASTMQDALQRLESAFVEVIQMRDSSSHAIDVPEKDR